MEILYTLLIVAFCLRNYPYTYTPENDEVPLFQTRVCNPMRLDASVPLTFYRYYFVLGRKTYSYELIDEVSIQTKWYSHRPEICVDRYEDNIRTHRYLFFLGKEFDRIEQELIEGKKRCGWVAEPFTQHEAGNSY
jgi:hypothetical protein